MSYSAQNIFSLLFSWTASVPSYYLIQSILMETIVLKLNIMTLNNEREFFGVKVLLKRQQK